MKDGFLKAAAFSPALRVADCTYNVQQVLAQLQAAAQRGVKLAVFPEFCLTGYTCGDLFLQRTLQQGALDALEWLLAQTHTLDTVALVGLPLPHRCTCRLTRPGIKYAPFRLTSCAPAGPTVEAAGPTALIRPLSSTATVIFSCGCISRVPSSRVACVNT